MNGLPERQGRALDLLRLARASDDTTSDGITTSAATFYDGEIQVAYVHWRTARALHRRGYIDYGWIDPEQGTELVLRRNA